MTDHDPLDLDLEYFNPKVSRKRYEKMGFPTAMIDALVEIDEALYENGDPEELRRYLREGALPDNEG